MTTESYDVHGGLTITLDERGRVAKISGESNEQAINSVQLKIASIESLLRDHRKLLKALIRNANCANDSEPPCAEDAECEQCRCCDDCCYCREDADPRETGQP